MEFEKVGRREDANEAAVFDDREVIDDIAIEQASRLSHADLRADGRRVRRHDMIDGNIVHQPSCLGYPKL